MAVSVPPPLYHLPTGTKFRDEPSPIKSTKNKRKSLEPKKLSSPDSTFTKRIKIEQCLDGSDGEATHSPGSASCSSTSSNDGQSLPSPSGSAAVLMAPKMRFKKEAMKLLDEKNSLKDSEKISPFRPWDDGATSPINNKQGILDNHFLRNPFFPIPGFYPTLMAPQPHIAITPKLEPPSSPVTPSPVVPVVSPVTPHDLSKSKFDAETCQVLSRLYPFLMNRASASSSSEPEQEEPLALVKRRTDDENDIMVSIKEEPGSGSNDERSPSVDGGSGKAKQRNYKNMTRERRIEANARERQRVHTITAAFDRLQGAIPTADDTSGSGANKLSKLSVIKIATSYIMVLSRMAGHDYSQDQSAPSIEECIKQCAELVKAEAKTRKKSSESSD